VYWFAKNIMEGLRMRSLLLAKKKKKFYLSKCEVEQFSQSAMRTASSKAPPLM